MFHPAAKVTIIAERLLQERIAKIIEQAGASGYTVVDGSGKGEHFHPPQDRAAVVSAFSIVRIEALVKDIEVARRIGEEVATRYFRQYSGIVYVSPAEVLRPERF